MTDFTHTPAKKKNIMKWLMPIIAVVIIAAIVGITLVLVNKKEEAPKAKADGVSVVNGYSLRYPSSWRSLILTDSDKNDGVALKLAKKGESSSYVMRIVEGELAKDFDIQKLPDQVVMSFEKKVAHFKLLDKSVIKLGEFDAAEVHYKQDDPKLKTSYENRMYIVPRENHTYYLTISTKGNTLSAISSDTKKITDNITQYIVAHP
jgi:hypothetical protein